MWFSVSHGRDIASLRPREKSKVGAEALPCLLQPLPCGKRDADVAAAQASRRPQGDGYRPGLAHNGYMKPFDVQPLNVKIDNRGKELIPASREILSHTELLLCDRDI